MIEKYKRDMLIEFVNDIIEHAIYYGGDSGGPYFDNSELAGLIEAMEHLKYGILKDDYEIGIVNRKPMFFEKVTKDDTNMNHDYCHCLDCDIYCPDDCFRAQLTRDLKPNKVVTFAHLKGTDECKRKSDE